MEPPQGLRADGYESFYREFDSPLMRQIRREAYGEDIGQHSWVGAEELRGPRAIERAVVLSRGPEIDVDDLPEAVRSGGGARAAGLEVEDLYGWFDRRPFDESSEEFVWVARKPG